MLNISFYLVFLFGIRESTMIYFPKLACARLWAFACIFIFLAILYPLMRLHRNSEVSVKFELGTLYVLSNFDNVKQQILLNILQSCAHHAHSGALCWAVPASVLLWQRILWHASAQWVIASTGGTEYTILIIITLQISRITISLSKARVDQY